MAVLNLSEAAYERSDPSTAVGMTGQPATLTLDPLPAWEKGTVGLTSLSKGGYPCCRRDRVQQLSHLTKLIQCGYRESPGANRPRWRCHGAGSLHGQFWLFGYLTETGLNELTEIPSTFLTGLLAPLVSGSITSMSSGHSGSTGNPKTPGIPRTG